MGDDDSREVAAQRAHRLGDRGRRLDPGRRRTGPSARDVLGDHPAEHIGILLCHCVPV
jgi:hypothetical protein